MKTKLLPLVIAAAGLFTVGAQAQVAMPSTPAPAIDIPTTQTQQPNQTVYTPRLPTAAELTNVAAAQGLTIDKIVQSASQMTVVYRSANGQTNTVAYMLLPAPGSPTGSTVVAATSAPQVVYAPTYAAAPAPAYYYDPFYYPSYYAGPWYAPVSLSLGFGWHGGGWRGGGWHGGGFHGGHRWR